MTTPSGNTYGASLAGVAVAGFILAALHLVVGLIAGADNPFGEVALTVAGVTGTLAVGIVLLRVVIGRIPPDSQESKEWRS